MKKPVDLSFATVLTPAEMNTIHFGGNISPLTPEQIEQLAHKNQPNQTPSAGEKPAQSSDS